MKHITLAHGSGGISSARFIQEICMPYLHDLMDYGNEDGGIFHGEKHAVSTDSYIINPIFFNGGDIGKLCICGSSNDVAMMGAKPLYINIGFIIEEGFMVEDFKKILESIRAECLSLGLKILSADTKVLPRLSTKERNIFINTTCMGEIRRDGISTKNISDKDCLIINADIGRHGARIFLDRHDMEIQSDIKSDCASLYPMLDSLLSSDIPIHAMRDATRGGIAAVLNEWAIASDTCIYVDEERLEISTQVRGVCEMLGLEPYDLANEGVCVIALPESHAKEALEILKRNSLGKNSSIIGRVSRDTSDSRFFGRVILQTAFGSKRFLEYPQGELLPRIC